MKILEVKGLIQEHIDSYGHRVEDIKKHGFSCFDEKETEFLTARGWLRFDDVSSNDEIASVNSASGEIYYDKPLGSISKNYTGKMYILEPYLTRAVLTPDHKLLVSQAHRSKFNNWSSKYNSSHAKWELRSTEEILSGNKIAYHIRRNCISSRKDYPVDNEYLALAGLFLSDGTISFRKNVVNAVVLAQYKCGKFHEAADLLNNKYHIKKYTYPVPPKKKSNYKHYSMWFVRGEVSKAIYKDFGHASNKHLPFWCYKLSKRQVEILWKHLMMGDGSEYKNKQVYYTSSKKLADDIQALLTSAGVLSIQGPYATDTPFGKTSLYYIMRPKISDTYHMLHFGKILKINQTPHPRGGYPIKEILVKNRRVVCFNMPQDTLITRSRGKVSIQGNCKFASHLIRLLDEGLEFLVEGRLNFPLSNNNLIRDIKLGKLGLDEILGIADRREKLVEEAYIHSPLPNNPDLEKIDELQIQLLKDFWGY